MPITAVDKMKINKYLKEHANGDIYYLDLCDAIGRRDKISHVEFLDFFTEYAVKEFRNSKEISINRLSKVLSIIDTFLEWIYEAKFDVSDETLDKIRNFKSFYEEYLDRTGMKPSDEFINTYISGVLNKVNQLFPTTVDNESVSKYLTKIAELEEEIKRLGKELGDVTKLYENVNKLHEKKVDKILELRKEKSAILRESKKKDGEVLKLNDKVDSLNEKLKELELFLFQSQNEAAFLLPYKEWYESLSAEVEELKKVIQEENDKKTAVVASKTRQSNLTSLIYQKLLFERVNLDNLVEYIQLQGFSTNSSEIASIISRMKQIINVDSSVFSVKPTYKIVTPQFTENGHLSIDIPNDCKYYDLMLVADFHIKKINDSLLSNFDMLNNYCVSNGINLILNLGDFYDGYRLPLKYDNVVKMYDMLEKSIDKIPRADGVYHALLGGNHEKNIAKYGLDPIAILTKERDDFINLGYTHSTISLESDDISIGKFDIHHPDTFDIAMDILKYGVDMSTIDDYLSKIYSNQERSRDDSYVDIFGHMHKNQVNNPGFYSYIASYAAGEACHLRIYLDENTGINYMVFMPLNSDGHHLIKNNEIVYQKKLCK